MYVCIDIGREGEREQKDQERERQRERERLQELAHTTVEAGKSLHLLSVNWRTSIACGITQSKPEGLRTRNLPENT